MQRLSAGDYIDHIMRRIGKLPVQTFAEWLMMKAIAKKTADASMGRGARFSHLRNEFVICAGSGFKKGSASIVLTSTRSRPARTVAPSPPRLGSPLLALPTVEGQVKEGRMGALTRMAKTINSSQGEIAAIMRCALQLHGQLVEHVPVYQRSFGSFR